MDGEIPSAARGEDIGGKLTELAEREGVSRDQIAAEALELYVRLQNSGREAWRSFAAADNAGLLDEAAWVAGRAMLNLRFDRAVASGLKNFKSPLPADASEQEIEDYAVKICRVR